MTDSIDRRAALADVWRVFAENEASGYSRLYAAIADGVADDDDLLDLVLEAPPRSHYPLMLLASVHNLVLSGLEHPLAEVYAGRSTGDPIVLFRDVCLSHREQLLAMMESRRIQTNECGRSPLIALGLAAIASEFGEPEIFLDAGASAGLNLLYDRYTLDYGSLGTAGDPDSLVRIACEVMNPDFALPEVPVVRQRVGIDRSPVNLDDPGDVRWLLACVWPDTGRLERTAAALEMAVHERPLVIEADMVTELPSVLADASGAGRAGLAVVLTSLSFSYLVRDARETFQESLHDAARDRNVVWMSLEPIGTVEGVAPPEIPGKAGDVRPVVLGIRGFGALGGCDRALALTHPHGAWVRFV